MAVTGTPMTPGATPSSGGINRAAYEATAEEATYEQMQLVPLVDSFNGPIYGQGIVRKWARVTGTTLAQTASGVDLTYLDPRGVAVTITPVGRVVPIGWSQNMKSETDINLDAGASASGTGAMAELLEGDCAANFASGTVIVSGAAIDAATLRQLRARLIGNTNGLARKKKVYAWFSHTQEPALMGIPEVNSAEMRGDSENPYVKGLWVNGFGMSLMTSTVVYQDANGWHNAVFLEEALKTGWNERTLVKRQEEELFYRYILYSNMGSNVQHDARMVIFRSTASQL